MHLRSSLSSLTQASPLGSNPIIPPKHWRILLFHGPEIQSYWILQKHLSLLFWRLEGCSLGTSKEKFCPAGQIYPSGSRVGAQPGAWRSDFWLMITNVQLPAAATFLLPPFLPAKLVTGTAALVDPPQLCHCLQANSILPIGKNTWTIQGVKQKDARLSRLNSLAVRAGNCECRRKWCYGPCLSDKMEN